MIVGMLKVYVVSAATDRDALMHSFGKLGVVHLSPVDPAKAVAGEKTLAAIDTATRAIQILSGQEPAGTKPQIRADQAAEESVGIRRRSAEAATRLAALHRQIERLAMWGDVRLEQFEQLRRSGVDVQFFSVPQKNAPDVQAELVQVLGDLPGKRTLVAVVNRAGEVSLPEQAEPVSLPQRDRPSIRKEAAEIDAALKVDSERLTELAHMVDEIKAWQTRLQHDAEYTIATKGAVSGEHLFAVQGWTPADKAESLAADLAAAGIEAAVQTFQPAEDEEPPTLIRYPRWTRPIKGLFDVLATNPGYRELDLSGFFMLALPLFAAMIIGDAGYGLIFLTLPLLWYRKMVAVAGKPGTHLLIVVGAATMVWGILTGNCFGVTPASFAEGSSIRRTMTAVAVLWQADEEAARFLIMKVSFLIGTTHLISAHLRQAVGYWPNTKAWSQIGWSCVLGGMLAIIWRLFEFPMPDWLLQWALVTLGLGYCMAIYFSYPRYGIVKRIAIGFAASLLPLISTFGDTMSYIRLMAVGLASYYIAAAFNGLGAMVAQKTPVLWVVGVPIILLGHSLNIALAVIAVFAHGVRLNMLEFSTNAGIQWAGYAYKPFVKH